jgi:hypothetical protein
VSLPSTSCPYCLSDIPSQALVCRQCTRDVSLFKTLQAEITKLKNDNQSLKRSLENFEKLEGQTLDQILPGPFPASATEQLPKNWPIWLAGFITVFILGCLHWMLFFLYDTPVVVFRVTTFCIPVLLGFMAGSLGRSFWLHEWSVALIAGIASVVLMLNITHHIDEVPLWPQNLRDWRETIEYSLSISLALLTGLLSWGAYEKWRHTQLTGNVLFLLQRDEQGRLKLEQLTSNIQHLIATVAPIFSGAMAVYSALKSLLD